MLTKEGLLGLLDRIKEAVGRGSVFGVIRYEVRGEEYIVHAQIDSFTEDTIGKEAKIAAL